MNSIGLARHFQELTGFEPMAWQNRLYLEYFDRGKIPAGADIPTGLGKTAIMALWLIAMRQGKRLPKRLVYVVDRRAVVDQATAFVEGLRERLPHDERFPISTLRGQYADNEEWLDDPSQPAIIVGTVDMIGSRLLFEGYGVSRKMRPYHAGLLGTDTLIVLDEAHLVPPFERLLEDIEVGHSAFAPSRGDDRGLIPGLRLLSLSATGRERKGEVFRLSDEDVACCALTRRRLHAVKRLTVRPGDKNHLVEQLVDAAWELSGSGSQPLRCLVYCNFRDHAEKVRMALEGRAKKRPKNGPLPEVETELFIGARRGHERDLAAARLRELGFLAGSEVRADRLCFLIATSAGEVGVDLDADHMVCDLVAWERMVQRLGRVNRRGDNKAEVIVIDAGEDISKLDQEAHALLRTLVERLPPEGNGHDASPQAIRQLQHEADDELREALSRATTPSPLRPALTRPLLDAWSMTSLKTHTGRPEVAPWLRGWVEEEPQTVVVWRSMLPIPRETPARHERQWVKDVESYFEATPIHVSEQLETDTHRVVDWLRARARKLMPTWDPKRNGDIVAIVLTPEHEVANLYTLDELDDAARGRLHGDLAGKLLIVDGAIGGLSPTGSLDAKEDSAPAWMADRTSDAVFGDESTPIIPWRVEHILGSETAEPGPCWLWRFALTLARNADGEATERLVIYKWNQTAAMEDDRAIGNAQYLDDHQAQVKRHARKIGQRAGLPESHIALLELAASLHDEGKRAMRWQRAFNAPRQGPPHAKTPGPVDVRLLDGYRHEFGSLHYAEQHPDMAALEAEQKDLVLHLIAAHHGNARPTISTRGCDHAPPSILAARARDVALRFARLQRQWGPWGLAWWEALLRSADQKASKENASGENR